MQLKKIYNPTEGQMRVVALMSGTGTNLVKIIEHEKRLDKERGKSPYHIVVIFSDTFDSNATRIGKDYDIPVITHDIKGFYSAKNKPRKDLETRVNFDNGTVKALSPYNIKVAVYAGYMGIATKPLVNAFLGINVHPADLSIIQGNKRKYAGTHAVRKAILAGEKYLKSTTHIIEPRVDYGNILMISQPLKVELGDNFDPNDKAIVKKVEYENQERLKKAGDWIIFPKALQYIAEGRYSKDKTGHLYFDEKPIPDGLKL